MMLTVVLLFHIRVIDGTVKAGDKIRMMATGKEFEVTEVGVFKSKAHVQSMN